MFPQMLKYIVIYMIISCCQSSPNEGTSELGDYEELLLVQHLSKDHGWVIRGFWSVDDDGRLLTNCVDYFGDRPTFDDDVLKGIVQFELETKWPVLIPDQAEKDLWESEYHKYGSCIEDDPTNYFGKAVLLFEENQVKNILLDANIHPGHNYNYTDLVQSVNSTLGREVFVNCVLDEETQQQHLSDITLCYNELPSSINCRERHPELTEINECQTDKKVYYPEFNELNEEELIHSFMTKNLL